MEKKKIGRPKKKTAAKKKPEKAKAPAVKAPEIQEVRFNMLPETKNEQVITPEAPVSEPETPQVKEPEKDVKEPELTERELEILYGEDYNVPNVLEIPTGTDFDPFDSHACWVKSKNVNWMKQRCFSLVYGKDGEAVQIGDLHLMKCGMRFKELLDKKKREQLLDEYNDKQKPMRVGKN